MKKLIIYYSRTGNSEKVAKILGKETNGTVEKIHDYKNRKGILGYLRSGYEGSKRLTCEITGDSHNPSEFDEIIIITPVWAGVVSTAIRSYLYKYKDSINKYKVIVTRGGSPINKLVDEVTSILSKSPEKIVAINDKDLKNENFSVKQLM